MAHHCGVELFRFSTACALRVFQGAQLIK
jgi:hypothetical protein